MATVDLGKLKPVWKGTWAGSTSYEKDDMVQEGVNSYICTTAHTSDASTFSNDSANWDTMATGANIPTQTGNSGKVLKTDGSSLSWGDGLPTGGTNGQYITTDGTTASWGDVSSDLVKLYDYTIPVAQGTADLQIREVMNSDYNHYKVVIHGKATSSNSGISMRFFTGTNTEVSQASYYTAIGSNYCSSGGDGVTSSRYFGSTYIRQQWTMNGNWNLDMDFMNCSGGKQPQWCGRIWGFDGTTLHNLKLAGWLSADLSPTGFRFENVNGNEFYYAGTRVKVYGYK